MESLSTNDDGLTWAITRALDVWGAGEGDDRARWQTLQRNGMGLLLVWSHRIEAYASLYRQLGA